MRDIVTELLSWQATGAPYALCTIVDTSGSAPRPAGTSMAVNEAGEVIGSLSGGCVEGAVYQAAIEVLAGGPARVEHYGFSDETAFGVGLTCGGELEVLIALATADPAVAAVLNLISTGAPVALATVIAGPAGLGRRLAISAQHTFGGLGGSAALDRSVAVDARGQLSTGGVTTRFYGRNGERLTDEFQVMIHAQVPPPRLLVLGAIDFAGALAHLGRYLGYRVTVCDARATFATRKRFPQAHEVVCEWPHRYLAGTEIDERTAICVLTHDPKFDVPVLQLALRSRAGYIGAMGSRRTHRERLVRLREVGLTDAELSRLRSPIGLELGGRSPEETALGIAAELLQERYGGSGQPLWGTERAIHPDSTAGAGAPVPAG